MFEDKEVWGFLFCFVFKINHQGNLLFIPSSPCPISPTVGTLASPPRACLNTSSNLFLNQCTFFLVPSFRATRLLITCCVKGLSAIGWSSLASHDWLLMGHLCPGNLSHVDHLSGSGRRCWYCNVAGGMVGRVGWSWRNPTAQNWIASSLRTGSLSSSPLGSQNLAGCWIPGDPCLPKRDIPCPGCVVSSI